ncbi:MAG: NADH-quinone oxidoreductase subunit C [Lachnospiraceae bacterium]|jgi:hypothetical protein|nr:NADH-quinone oxidoreductase subunit C [Lachnospiraceae bacterium]MCI1329252.1 NADH-quinone oxidoreductase subunit C [Lachnospiraceae bacterium]
MTVIEPVQKFEDVQKGDLLITVMRKRQEGLRLVQICCAVVNNQYEVLYSFTDDDTYVLTNVRVMVGLNDTIPSICDSYPYANYYENEMAEMFGLKIEMIDGDYHGKFYRIEAEEPFLNEKAKEARALEAEEIRKAAEEAANMPEPEIKVVKKEGGVE